MIASSPASILVTAAVKRWVQRIARLLTRDGDASITLDAGKGVTVTVAVDGQASTTSAGETAYRQAAAYIQASTLGTVFTDPHLDQAQKIAWARLLFVLAPPITPAGRIAVAQRAN